MCEERRWHTNCSQTNRVLEGNGCDCNRETDKEGIRQSNAIDQGDEKICGWSILSSLHHCNQRKNN